MHLDLVSEAREDGRTAARAEKPLRIFARLSRDRHRIFGEDCGSVEQSAMMFAAIEAVTKADPIGVSRRHDPDVTAKATALESIPCRVSSSRRRPGSPGRSREE